MAVLYTTHYMEEAERLCDRLGIIDQGRLMAEGTQHDLVQIVGQHDRVRLVATGPLNACAGAFREITAVEQAGVAADGIDLIVHDAHGLLPEIFEVASKMEVVVSSVDIDSANLEAVFLQLTGRALRE
jgi:ABC-2 type transport system ATP-binding protein